MKEENKKKAIILIIIAVSSLLIVVFGATYAYFQIIATNNVTNTNMQGSTDTMPKGVLLTNITELKINLDAKLMSEGNKGKTYYATPSGTPVTTASEGSGKYVLATASLDKSGISYDCVYSYAISATRTKAINDGSDADVKVRITGSDGYTETYTLAELLSGNQTYSGNIKGLTYGTNQKIYIEAYVENTSSKQDDLAGNSFSFKIELVSNSFSCDTSFDITNARGKEFAQFLVDNNTKIDGLWQSGLEGDGYRYVGSGAYDSATTPSNFICFGTSDKTECKNDVWKYMYRIIGVFEGSDGKQHLKLISFKRLQEYKWHSDDRTDVAWENSDLYTGLNGNYFLTGSTYGTYDYMQNNAWLNKIEDWTWSAVNTKTYSDNGPDYYNSLTPSEIYLHEMNKSSKTSTIGEWTTPVAKIGLMYVSDYILSLGDNALSITGGTYDNRNTLKTGWLLLSNNIDLSDTTEWTMSRVGGTRSFGTWSVDEDGSVLGFSQSSPIQVRQVFYLTEDVAYKSGTGNYADPYILE